MFENFVFFSAGTTVAVQWEDGGPWMQRDIVESLGSNHMGIHTPSRSKRKAGLLHLTQSTYEAQPCSQSSMCESK